MNPRVKRGQHALIVDADFPDRRQPLVQLIYILFGKIEIRWTMKFNVELKKEKSAIWRQSAEKPTGIKHIIATENNIDI